MQAIMKFCISGLENDDKLQDAYTNFFCTCLIIINQNKHFLLVPEQLRFNTLGMM